MNFKTALLALSLLPASFAEAGQSGATVALLSSGSGAYMEAFSAFQAVYGSEVKYFDVSKEKPRFTETTRTAVAFGGRAAGLPYPPGMSVVYCMAPGFFQDDIPAGSRAVKISMVPRLGLLAAQFKAIQPGIRRLRVFWKAPGFGDYIGTLKKEAAPLGIEVETVKVDQTDDLPEILRQSLGKMDAFWLPPDPLLISPETLMIFKEFSWDNGVPYYASSKALAREGATAAFAISFRDIGGAAALAVKSMDAGEKPVPVVFLDKVELTLNASAARKCGITFPPEILKEASYLLP